MAVIATALAALGVLAGVASSSLPVLILFGIILGIAVFLIIFWKPFVGLWLFLVFNMTLPQAGLDWDLGIRVAVVGETRGIHFNIHEIVITMTLIVVIIHTIIYLMKTGDWEGVWQGLWKSPIAFAVVLYVLTSILASFIGLINDANSLIVIFRLVRTVLFFYIFFLVIHIVKTRKQFQWLVITMLVCATLVAAFGIVQWAAGQAWAEEVAEKVLGRIGYPEDVNYVAGESEAQAYRINATFLHPNVLGAYLVFALPFFVSFLSMAWRKRRLVLWVLMMIGLIINGASLYLTGSRAAWLAAGTIFLLYGFLGLMDRRFVMIAVTALMIIALVFVIINPPEFVKKRFVGLSAKEAASIRMSQYKLAIDFFMERPFLGLGMGMEGERIMTNNIRMTWAAVENAFLTYLVSHGLIGLTAYLLLFALFWMVLMFARHRSRGDPFVYYNAEAFILGMVGFFVSSQFGAWLLFAIPMVTLFMFYLGMGGVLGILSREGEASHDTGRLEQKGVFNSTLFGYNMLVIDNDIRSR